MAEYVAQLPKYQVLHEICHRELNSELKFSPGSRKVAISANHSQNLQSQPGGEGEMTKVENICENRQTERLTATNVMT